MSPHSLTTNSNRQTANNEGQIPRYLANTQAGRQVEFSCPERPPQQTEAAHCARYSPPLQPPSSPSLPMSFLFLFLGKHASGMCLGESHATELKRFDRNTCMLDHSTHYSSDTFWPTLVTMPLLESMTGDVHEMLHSSTMPQGLGLRTNKNEIMTKDIAGGEIDVEESCSWLSFGHRRSAVNDVIMPETRSARTTSARTLTTSCRSRSVQARRYRAVWVYAEGTVGTSIRRQPFLRQCYVRSHLPECNLSRVSTAAAHRGDL